jgi:hypothetical protein
MVVRKDIMLQRNPNIYTLDLKSSTHCGFAKSKGRGLHVISASRNALVIKVKGRSSEYRRR